MGFFNDVEIITVMSAKTLQNENDEMKPLTSTPSRRRTCYTFYPLYIYKYKYVIYNIFHKFRPVVPQGQALAGPSLISRRILEALRVEWRTLPPHLTSLSGRELKYFIRLSGNRIHKHRLYDLTLVPLRHGGPFILF